MFIYYVYLLLTLKTAVTLQLITTGSMEK